jgi:hypothetical protein
MRGWPKRNEPSSASTQKAVSINLIEDDLHLEESIGNFSTSHSYQEEHPIASTSECLDITISSTSPTCEFSQGNVMVSGDSYGDSNDMLNCDDMFDMPCCHDPNASISSSCCMANHVE